MEDEEIQSDVWEAAVTKVDEDQKFYRMDIIWIWVQWLDQMEL